MEFRLERERKRERDRVSRARAREEKDFAQAKPSHEAVDRRCKCHPLAW